MSAELEARAQIVIDSAKHTHDISPKSYQNEESYSLVTLPNDFDLELSYTREFRGESELQNTARVFVYRKDDPITERHDCYPIIHCDLSRAQKEGIYSGGKNTSVDEVFITQGVPTDDALYDLVAFVVDSVQKSQETVEHSFRVQQAAVHFKHLLTLGGVVAFDRVFQKFEDGTQLLIEHNSFSGNLPPGILSYAKLFPEIIVAAIDGTVRYQLEYDPARGVESFRRPACSMEYNARYVPAENIRRNDQGRIISISGGDGNSKTVLIEAERAAGLRDLNAVVLDKIEAGLNRWKFPDPDVSESNS